MNTMNRRRSLKTGAFAGGALILPGLSMGKRSRSANDKLNVALIGSGGIARTCFNECDEENVVAIAEVDEVQGAPGLERYPQAEQYKDFRRMLDRHYKELDAVIVSTPDHTHFVATFAAMERGIAVHTQKPLTHNIWEARILQNAAQKFKVQTVMGNQGHNNEGMRLIKDWYDAGLLGDVSEVHAWNGRSTPNNWNAEHPLRAQPVPETLDWDLWTGPAELKDYNSSICPSGWRWWWTYGSGGLGDIGCHTLDIPKFAMELGYPASVHVDDSIDFSDELDDRELKKGAGTYVFRYGRDGKRPPLTIYWYEGGHMPRIPEALKSKYRIAREGGCLMVGDKNTLYSPGMRPDSPRLVYDWEEIRSGNLPPKTTPRAVGNPVQELFAAVRGDIPKCGSNFIDYAVPLTEMVLLGTIARRSGKKVEYIPQNMTFRDSTLNHYIKEPVRKGWEVG